MDKNILSQISSANSEIQDLKNRLHKLEEKSQKVVIDSVKGSSSSYPYIEHTCTIEGLEKPKYKKTKKKYRALIMDKEEKLIKLIKQAEYELNYVEDSELRQIIRLVYYDNKSYNQTAHIMNKHSSLGKYTADSIRMKLKRFFEKNKKN